MDEINTVEPKGNPSAEDIISSPRYIQKGLRFTESQWARVEALSALAIAKGLIPDDRSFTSVVLLAIESAINYLNQVPPSASPASETPGKLLSFDEIVRANLSVDDSQWLRIKKLAEYAHAQGLMPDSSLVTFLKFALLACAEDTLKKFYLNDEGFK
jgi:hypothetical protein